MRRCRGRGLPAGQVFNLNPGENSHHKQPRKLVQHSRRVTFAGLARDKNVTTSGVTGRRSNQLSYSRFGGREGFRLRTRMRQAGSSPRAVRILVGGDGFEPPTLSV